MAELGVRELFDVYDVEKLCFRGHLDKDLQGFPEVNKFIFLYEAYLALNPRSLYVQEDATKFCLTMKQSIDRETTIIGLKAQQNHGIAYDVQKI